MVISSIVMGKVKPRYPAQWFCASLVIMGFAVVLMAYSPQVLLFSFWNLISGLCLPAADLPIGTYVQLSVEDAFRGRTNSVLNLVGSSASPIGMALGGMFVAKFGLAPAFLTMGGLCAGGSLVGLLDRRFRTIEMPETPAEAA
jgi:MFS family permease